MAVEHSAEARGQLVALLRRRMRLLIALVVLGMVVGVGAGFLLPAEYSATASVLVKPLEGNPYSPEGRGDDLINLETEAQLVQTDAVAELAQQQLKDADIATLRARVSTAVPPNTQILNISYNGGSGDAAETGARTFAESYLKYRQQRAQAVVDGKLKKLDEQTAKVQQNLQQANQQYASASGAQRNLLKQRISSYANQLGVIGEQKNDVSSTPIDPGQVINPASAGGAAAIKRIGMFGAGGLVLGAVLALSLAVVRERLDRRLHTAEQVSALGLRVLSVLPADPAAREGKTALQDGARTPTGDAYRRLRSGIVAHIRATPITMLIASATPRTTTSMTATNLSVALAAAGSDTILVDATADEPDPAAAFGLPPGKGLAEILLNGTDPAALLIHADSQLRLLPRGGNPAAATHRFSGPRMRDAVDTLHDRADFVLVNSPDVHDADTQALCTLVDTVVLVMQEGVTTREDLQQAYAEVVHAGSTVLGVVIESSSDAPARPVRHAAPRPDPQAAPAGRQAGARRADARQPDARQPGQHGAGRRRAGPPGGWGRDTETPRSEAGAPVDEFDTNTTVKLPALPAGSGKGSAHRKPPAQQAPPQGRPQQQDRRSHGRRMQGPASPAQSPAQQDVPVSRGLAKSAPAGNASSGRPDDESADRGPGGGQSGSRDGSRDGRQHFGSDRIAGRDPSGSRDKPDPDDKSVAGGAEGESPANRTRDDLGHL